MATAGARQGAVLSRLYHAKVQIQRLTLAQILDLVRTRPEQVVFDTKRDFAPPRGDGARAEFIKDVVAIANGTAFTGGPGFIVYGVDPNLSDPVLGVSERYDDAALQQLVAAHVEPMIEFVFYDDVDAGQDRRLAVLQLQPSRQPFHVIVKDVGGLRDGTSFIRQGSSTRGVRRADWMRLCLGPDSQYLAAALRQHGQEAAMMNAQANLSRVLQDDIDRIDRDMRRMVGLE